MATVQARIGAEIGLGAKAPDVELRSEAGDTALVSSYWQEQPLVLVLLNVLHVEPLVNHLLVLRDAHETFDEAGGQIVVVVRNDTAEIAAFRAKHNIPYPVLSDISGIAHNAYGVSPPGPSSFVIDQGGVVRYARHAATVLDTPSTWELIDAVCGLTGEVIERPELPNVMPTPISGRNAKGEHPAFVAGVTLSAVNQASYACGKCGNTSYELVKLATAGGWLSRMFNFQYRKFVAVVCTACNYAELYRTKGGTIANISDILAGG